MTEEKKLEPELRFPGFHEPWEEKKLGDFGEVSSCKRVYERETSHDGDVPFFKIGTFGREADAYISNNLFEEYKKKYNFPKKGDVLISASGTIGRIIKYNGERAYFQDSNIVWFDIKEKGLINEFLYNFYQTVSWNKLEGGTIKRLYNKNLLNLIIRYPSLSEQEKIGKFFYAIDKKLDLQRERIEELKSYKKGMMQRIFDQEIRFKDEDGRDYPDWEETLVGELFDLTRGVVIAKKTLSSVKDNIYKYPVYSSQTINEGVLGWDKTYDFDKRILSWTTDGANAGKVELREGKYRCTNVCGIMLEKDTTKGFANKCLANIIDRETPKYVSYVGNPKLMNNVMREVKVIIPSLPEQEKIANFLSAIDRRIELEEEKLELYEDFKKGLMQRMFV